MLSGHLSFCSHFVKTISICANIKIIPQTGPVKWISKWRGHGTFKNGQSKIFKGCLPQILLGPVKWISKWRGHGTFKRKKFES